MEKNTGISEVPKMERRIKAERGMIMRFGREDRGELFCEMSQEETGN
ncbi:MAG: hypothetical protein ACE5I5_10420 [Candidatus Heimdallarchaeota archaeon]